ncbi:MAG: DUF1501 domain-containing protein [Phycisphaeraceae bacterium]|nr:MAG: DUF1501 domain-containing protein [Phycisphaeraceae bacterium]
MHHNDASEARAWTRRELLGTGLIMASAAMTMPMFLQRSALALPNPASGPLPGVPEDRILVVVQLGGGNDGLNTVAPVGHDAYHSLRPAIHITPQQALMLDKRHADIGLHPALEGLKGLYDDGMLSLVQGVGYPNPNRSHFKSMDIWQTADTSGTGDGWLGRYCDSECCGYGAGESGTAPKTQGKTSYPPISIGNEAPLALQGRATKPVAFETPDLFRWTGEQIHESLVKPYAELVEREPDPNADAGSNAAFLMRTTLEAQISSDQIRKAVAARSLVDYPNSELGQQLGMIAKMIRAGLKTRVYYATMGGFDTHAGQGGANGRHANLLRQFGAAMRAFYADLKQQGNADRVLAMSFSEFGRRAAQNASGGTDHGTAAPMFLFGPMVNAGVMNPHPSLTDLDSGDLKYTVDFRTVYAAILENWMKADSTLVLEQRYKPAPVIRKA